MSDETLSRLAEEKRNEAQAFLLERQRAYRDVFNEDSKSVKTVLLDLKRFCRENVTCFDPDPRIHAAYEGRREVILRVRDHLELDPDILLALYRGVENG